MNITSNLKDTKIHVIGNVAYLNIQGNKVEVARGNSSTDGMVKGIKVAEQFEPRNWR